MDVLVVIQLKAFEYGVFYGCWEFSKLMGFEPIRDNGGNINKNVIKYFYSWRKNSINFVLLYEEIFIGVLYGL